VNVFEEIKWRADILEVAGRYTELRRLGGRWRGKCPLHDDVRPSFVVWPDQGRWWCFACNTGGSVIDLVAATEGVSVREAAARLAAELGLSWGRPTRSTSPRLHEPTEAERRATERRWRATHQAWKDLYWWAKGDELAAEWCRLYDELRADPFCDDAARKWQRLNVIDEQLTRLDEWRHA